MNIKEKTRDEVAIEYRKLLIKDELGFPVDFEDINKSIIEKWSLPALDYIKKRAFLCRIPNKKRTYIVSKNTDLEWGVFLVSVKDFWSTGRVGFSSRKEAEYHLENMLNPRSIFLFDFDNIQEWVMAKSEDEAKSFYLLHTDCGNL